MALSRNLAASALATVALAASPMAQTDGGLVTRAKQEGRVVIYTSLAPTESGPLAAAFEKKYGIKAEVWRATSAQVVQRTVTEGRARRRAVDVIETNGPEMEMLAREKLLATQRSSHVADLPANAVPKHRAWVPDRMNYFVVGYNTSKVRKTELPATYEGFVDPKWKGRIGLEATDVEWLATLYKTWGEARAGDYFRKLSAMRPDMREGHVLLASLVAAGEVPVGLSMYSSNIIPLMRKGAPIDFVPVQPVVARPQGIGVASGAPHPNAAALFSDYVLSPEGQQLFESLGRTPASTRVKSSLNNFPFIMIDPITVLDESMKWEGVWRGYFSRRS
jgi:iron(III) transport system substrate-binding protein